MIKKKKQTNTAQNREIVGQTGMQKKKNNQTS